VSSTPAEAPRVVIVARDLIGATRIADAAERAGLAAERVDQPGDLPPSSTVAIAFVDWGDRRPDWATILRAWLDAAADPAPRVLLFGPHADIEAHDEARRSGLGPMMARSKLFASLSSLLPQ
jgi:hypothetical protein